MLCPHTWSRVCWLRVVAGTDSTMYTGRVVHSAVGVGSAEEKDQEEAGREGRQEGQGRRKRGDPLSQPVAAHRTSCRLGRLTPLQQTSTRGGGARRRLMIAFPCVCCLSWGYCRGRGSGIGAWGTLSAVSMCEIATLSPFFIGISLLHLTSNCKAGTEAVRVSRVDRPSPTVAAARYSLSHFVDYNIQMFKYHDSNPRTTTHACFS